MAGWKGALDRIGKWEDDCIDSCGNNYACISLLCLAPAGAALAAASVALEAALTANLASFAASNAACLGAFNARGLVCAADYLCL